MPRLEAIFTAVQKLHHSKVLCAQFKKKSVSALIAHLEPFTSAFLNAPAPATVLIDRTVASNTDHLTFFSRVPF